MFSIKLREARKKKGLNQKEAAKQLAMPRTTYSGYERGTSEPDFNTLKKLSDFYDVDSNWLLDDKKGNGYPLPEELMLKIIKEAEAEYRVSLRDDPVVESAVRDLIHNLAKMKKSAQKND